jgi:hypothetical protein
LELLILLSEGKKMQRCTPTGWFSQGRPHRVGAIRALGASVMLARFALCCVSLQAAPPPKPTEYDVKAAYLLDFGKFVRYTGQHESRTSFDICILGHDPMGQTLDSLAANESIKNIPVHIRRLPDVSEAKTCAILFISASDQERLREDLAIVGNADVLTVSDTPDFLDRGGMIQFLLVSNHVRFAINLEAVNRAHLELSSELLRVAASVSGKPPTGGLP